jgi:N-acetylneuraminic acid mutarotase
MLNNAAVYGITSFILLLLVIPISLAAATTSNNDHTKSFWTNGSPISTSRTEVSATAVGDSVYVIGGFNAQGQPTDIVEVYNTKNNTWSSAASLPHPLHHTAAATSLDGKIYVVGGFLDSQWTPSNRLFIYDPLKNQWREGKHMPTARGALTANFIDRTLYAVGGQSFVSSSSSSSPSGILTTNEAYDTASNTWTTKAPMITARHHAASAVVNGNLYVIGGRVEGISPTVNVNVNEVYDSEKNTWTCLAPMPSKRSGIAAANFVMSSIYVFGGEEPSKTFNNNERYDTKTNKWFIDAPMPTARHGLGAASVEDRIYVLGGGPQPGLSVSNANEIFHVVIDSFQITN